MIRKSLMLKEDAKVLINDLLQAYVDGNGKSLRFGEIQYGCHAAAVSSGWWEDPKTGQDMDRNVGALLMLIVTEVAEAMEGFRKDLKDDKLPDRDMMEVELADVIIRVLDLAVACGYDLEGIILRKLAYNLKREDHKPENRVKEGGKRV